VRLPTALVIQHAVGEDIGRFGGWLGDAGLLLDTVAAYDGAPVPEAPDGYAAVIVLGGGMSAGDDAAAPWLPATRSLLSAATAAQVPSLGICLGAQLLAAALGGRVEPGTEGPEVGPGLLAKRDASADDPLFRAVPFTPDVVQWHYDQISTLPAGATLLASSTRYPNQAFRIGRSWGLQFHPETTPEMVRRWAGEDRARLAELGIDVDALLERWDLDQVHADLEEVWQPFAARFVEVVRAAEYAARDA
jgi:GMP synthase-like glutamine amidotransferase